MEKDQEFIKSW
jgi:hypothetical protein